MAKIKVSDYIVQFFAEKGVKYVFGYIGGAVVHLVNSLQENKHIQFIQFYHEQNAAFAAEGYARHSQKIGIALATSGPGATNLITGIADAYFDSIPVVYLTGQVNTFEYKREKPIRQQGFQETDIVSIVKPITKYAVWIESPEKIRYELEKAYHIALTSRPGPVLLDIPMDVQRAEIDSDLLEAFIPDPQPLESGVGDSTIIQRIYSLLKSSKRPLVLVGGGCNHHNARELLLAFCEKNNIPVVASLMGKGAFPEDHPLYAGFIGSYGNRCANMILANADVLLALGTRLDTRQTGTQLDSFIRSGQIVHVDIDENEIKHNRIKRTVTYKADVKDFLSKILNQDSIENSDPIWANYIQKIKVEYSQEREVAEHIQNKLPYRIMELLNTYSCKDQIFCADIGQNQMFAAQMLKIKNGQFFFTSGGMAPMGYSICAAIGASFSTERKTTIFAIVGDGGLHISIQALLLLSQYKLPIKVIVLNNSSLGMIVQFQDLYFESKYAGTTENSGYLVPNIKHLAQAYFLEYFKVDKENMEDEEFIKNILTSPGSSLIEFDVGGNTVVLPKLQVNTSIEDLNPKLDRQRLKDSMLIDLYLDDKFTS